MVFTAITKQAEIYGQGTQIGIDRFEMFGGVKIFFYDSETIQEEFGKTGHFETTEVIENYPFNQMPKNINKLRTEMKKNSYNCGFA